MNLVQAAVATQHPYILEQAQKFLLGQSQSCVFEYEKTASKLVFLTALDPLSRVGYAQDLLEELVSDLAHLELSNAEHSFLNWLCATATLEKSDLDMIDLFLSFKSIVAGNDDVEADDIAKLFLQCLIESECPESITDDLERSDLFISFLNEHGFVDGFETALKLTRKAVANVEKSSDHISHIIQDLFESPSDGFMALMLSDSDGEHRVYFDSLTDVAETFDLDQLKHYGSDDFCFDCYSTDYEIDDIKSAIKNELEEHTAANAYDNYLQLCEMLDEDIETPLDPSATTEALIDEMVELLTDNDRFDLSSAFALTHSRALDDGARNELSEAIDKYECFDNYEFKWDHEGAETRMYISVPKKDILTLMFVNKYLYLDEFLNGEGAWGIDNGILHLIKEEHILGEPNDLDVPYYGFDGYSKDTISELIADNIIAECEELKFLFGR